MLSLCVGYLTFTIVVLLVLTRNSMKCLKYSYFIQNREAVIFSKPLHCYGGKHQTAFYVKNGTEGQTSPTDIYFNDHELYCKGVLSKERKRVGKTNIKSISRADMKRFICNRILTQ